MTMLSGLIDKVRWLMTPQPPCDVSRLHQAAERIERAAARIEKAAKPIEEGADAFGELVSDMKRGPRPPARKKKRPKPS